MGTVRCYTDDAGETVELFDHEGYVAQELTGRWTETSDYGESYDVAELDPDTDTWWTGSSSAQMPDPTYRYRPACSCGWKGPIADVAESDRWRPIIVDDPDNPKGWPPEELDDELLEEAWGAHVDQVIADRLNLAPIAEANQAVAAANRALVHAVATARQAGRSWGEIAGQLGVSRQAAWERFRHLDQEPSRRP